MLYYDRGLELTGTAGVLQVYYYSANGVYDPDVTGTGHQPVGFDQAMLFYEQYVVMRSTITVTFFANTSSARVGVFLNPDTSNPTLGAIMENGYVKSQLIVATTGRWTVTRITLHCDSIAYFNSRTKNLHMMRDNFTGTSAANPAEQVYFGIFTFNALNSSNTDVLFDVELSYDVRFWEPRKISQSLLHNALKQVMQEEKTGKKKK